MVSVSLCLNLRVSHPREKQEVLESPAVGSLRIEEQNDQPPSEKAKQPDKAMKRDQTAISKQFI